MKTVTKSRIGLLDGESDWSTDQFESSDEAEDLDELESRAWPPVKLLEATKHLYDQECILRRQDATFEMTKLHDHNRCLPCLEAGIKERDDGKGNPFEAVHPSLIPKDFRSVGQRRLLRNEKAARRKEEELQLEKAKETAQKIALASAVAKDKANDVNIQIDSSNPGATTSQTPVQNARKTFDFQERNKQIAAYALEKGIESKNQAKSLFLAEERKRKYAEMKKTLKEERATTTQPNVPKERQSWCPFPSYPNMYSIMTQEEHERMVGMMANYIQNDKFKFAGQAAEFKQMKERLEQNEYGQFKEFVKGKVQAEYERCKTSHTSQRRAYHSMFQFLPPTFNLFVQRRLKCLSEQLKTDIMCRSIIPNSYYIQKQITALTVSPVTSGPAVLEFQGAILDIGKPAKILLPDLKVKAVLDTSNTFLEKGYPANEATMFDGGVNSISDNTSKLLLEKYDLDIAMSAGTARALISGGTPARGSEFDIPILISNHISNGRFKRKMLFMKPLPPRSQNSVQRMWQFQKYALRSKLVHKKFDAEKAQSYSQKRQSSMKEDDPFGNSYEANIETFGQLPAKKIKLLVQSESDGEGGSVIKDKAKQSEAESADESALKIVEGSESKEENDSAADNKISSKSRGRRSATRSTSVKDMKGNGLTNEEAIRSIQSATDDSFDQVVDTDQGCLARTLRSTTSKNSKNAGGRRESGSPVKTPARKGAANEPQEKPTKKGELPKANVTKAKQASKDGENESETDVLDKIIGKTEDPVTTPVQPDILEDASNYPPPSKGDVCYLYSRWALGEHSMLIRAKSHGILKSDLCNSKQVPASIAVKVEYIPEYGGQEMSDTEWLYNWCTAQLQQSQHHVIGRIHYKESHILTLQHINVKSKYAKDRVKRKELLRQRMAWMNKLLNELKELEPGNYMMRHTGDMNVIIFKESSGGASAGVHVLDYYDEAGDWAKVLAPLPQFHVLYMPPSPHILLQWHRIRKIIPCTFNFKRDGDSPQLKLPSKALSKQQKKTARKRASILKSLKQIPGDKSKDTTIEDGDTEHEV